MVFDSWKEGYDIDNTLNILVLILENCIRKKKKIDPFTFSEM